MGVVIKPGAFQCSYSTFDEMRQELAIAAGYLVNDMLISLNCVTRKIKVINLEWDKISAENMEGLWEELPEDPLIVLLCHHDHTGIIPHEHCLKVADRLHDVRKNIAKLKWLDLSGKFEICLRIADYNNFNLEFY